MKNKTKLHRPTRQPRRFPTQTNPTTPQKRAGDRHEFLVLSYYPGMPAPQTPVAA
ncbi:hypothetical protein [Oleiharenicola lentus]|uniref:hypothetical protein n=1 Tax=Oleiharenicola lentus TaxID=2508720 RepID=UPI003F665657